MPQRFYDQRKEVSPRMRINMGGSDTDRLTPATTHMAGSAVNDHANVILPLPITTFTRKECDLIMAPVLRVALSHSGVCNNLPRAIVYAPLKYQGLGVPDIYIEQGLSKLMRFIKFGRKSQHLTSSLFSHNCEAMKMELGLNGYLLQHDPTIWDPIASSTWLKWTWKFAAQYRIQLRDNIPDFTLKRENDKLLMSKWQRSI
jgi:hypothetical protein